MSSTSPPDNALKGASERICLPTRSRGKERKHLSILLEKQTMCSVPASNSVAWLTICMASKRVQEFSIGHKDSTGFSSPSWKARYDYRQQCEHSPWRASRNYLNHPCSPSQLKRSACRPTQETVASANQNPRPTSLDAFEPVPWPAGKMLRLVWANPFFIRRWLRTLHRGCSRYGPWDRNPSWIWQYIRPASGSALRDIPCKSWVPSLLWCSPAFLASKWARVSESWTSYALQILMPSASSSWHVHISVSKQQMRATIIEASRASS